MLEQDLCRALGILDYLPVLFVDGGHHLSSGIEGRLAYSRIVYIQLVLVQAEIMRVVNEGALRWLAFRCMHSDTSLGVAAKGHSFGQHKRIVSIRIDDCHSVLGKGSGLIRADYLRAAKSLDGGELSYQGVFLRHGSHADGHDYSRDRRQSFGDSRDCESDRYYECVKDRIEYRRSALREEQASDNSEYENKKGDPDDELREHHGELSELLVERSLLVLGF